MAMPRRPYHVRVRGTHRGRGAEAKSAGEGAGRAGSGGVRRTGRALGLEGRGCLFGPREAASGLTGRSRNGPQGTELCWQAYGGQAMGRRAGGRS
jgi:hypothetical protein